MGLSLKPDTGTRSAIIPVPIRTVTMLPYGGVIPIRLCMVPIIMARDRFRPVGTMRLRRTGLIPIMGDTSSQGMRVQQKVHEAGTVILSPAIARDEEFRAGDR